MDLELTGKTALVSGSHRGTGHVIARRFAAEGCHVYVHGPDEGVARAAVAELGTGAAVWGDLLSDEGAAQVASQCEPQSVDILVNNFGAAARGSWDDRGASGWLDAYQTNVLSAQRLIVALLPGMRARGWGRIVNLGTVGSTKPRARMPQYYAAKGALATMTVSLAAEVKGSGVRVNLVSPGLIRTPEVEEHYLRVGRRKGWGDTWAEIEPHVAADTTIGRIATREEVADLVLFLASPRADAIHGQNIRIDGGALSIVS